MRSRRRKKDIRQSIHKGKAGGEKKRSPGKEISQEKGTKKIREGDISVWISLQWKKST